MEHFMSWLRDHEEAGAGKEFSYEEKIEDLPHKKMIRKRLEDRLERKRLKEELEEWEEDFDWDNYDR